MTRSSKGWRVGEHHSAMVSTLASGPQVRLPMFPSKNHWKFFLMLLWLINGTAQRKVDSGLKMLIEPISYCLVASQYCKKASSQSKMLKFHEFSTFKSIFVWNKNFFQILTSKVTQAGGELIRDARPQTFPLEEAEVGGKGVWLLKSGSNSLKKRLLRLRANLKLLPLFNMRLANQTLQTWPQ